MKSKPPERIPAHLRQKFRSSDLFPASDPLLRELHKRWKYCSEHTHPSMTAFARNASAGIADGIFRTRVVLYELGDEVPWEPLKSPCQNLDFREGRNLGEFGRTLSERKDLIGKWL